MENQRMMQMSMTGPRLRIEVGEIAPLSLDERLVRMKGMKKARLLLLADVLIRVNKGEVELDAVQQAILWKMPGGEMRVELQYKQ